MKRIISICLILTLALSLCACNQKEVPEVTDPTDVIVDIEGVETDSGWIVQDIQKPTVEDPVNLLGQKEQWVEMFTTSDIITNNFNLTSVSETENINIPNGDGALTVSTTTAMRFTHKETEDYIILTLVSTPGGTLSQAGFLIDYKNASETDINECQLWLTNLAKKILGDVGEYWMCAQDTDGFTFEGSSILPNPNDLSDRIQYDNGKILLNREVNDDGTWMSATITIMGKMLASVNKADKLLYDSLDFNFEQMLPESFGETNPLEKNSFGQKFINALIPDANTVTKTLSVSTNNNANDNANNVIVNFGTVNTVDSVQKIDCTLALNTKITQEGVIPNMMFEATYSDKNGFLSNEDKFNLMVKALEELGQSVDVSTLVYEEGKTSYNFTSIQYRTYDMNKQCNINIDLGENSAHILLNPID